MTRLEQRLAAYTHEQLDGALARRRAAVAAVLCRAPAPHLLLIERAVHPDDPWSGHMSLPGGQVEPDEGLLQAAMRETHEETGVDLAAGGRCLGQLDELQAIGRGRPLSLVISPFVFVTETQPPLRLNPREAQSALWLPLDYLSDPASLESLDYEAHGQRYELPCYRRAGAVVWGLTFRVIENLLRLI